MRRLLALVLWLAACQAEGPEWQRWSEAAASKHGEADTLLDHNRRREAEERLEQVIAAAPREVNDVARAVLEDTHFRLARLYLEDHEPRKALRQAEAGLTLAGRDDDNVIVANLLVVEGAAHEALGDTDAALEAYHRALRINEALLRETLGQP